MGKPKSDDCFAARAKQVREHFGGSLEAFGSRVGVAGPGWRVYEQGTSTPGFQVLKALYQLGVDPRWMLTGAGEMLCDAPDEGDEHSAELSRFVRILREVETQVPSSLTTLSERLDIAKLVHEYLKDIKILEGRVLRKFVSLLCVAAHVSGETCIELPRPLKEILASELAKTKPHKESAEPRS